MKICIAQIEVIPGEPELNTQKILKYIDYAEENECDIVAFSELCVSGYMLSDTWERTSFLKECKECQDKIVKATLNKSVAVIFGNVTFDESLKNEDGRIRKYNTAICAKNGEIICQNIKVLQPNYREFDDNRHFYDGRKLFYDGKIRSSGNVVNINGYDVSMLICEDLWDTDYTWKPMDMFHTMEGEYNHVSPDLVINLSCSPYTSGKNSKRNRVFSNNAKKYNTSIIYVNNVGVQNNGKNVFAFDGGSCIYDKYGNFHDLYPRFEERVSTFSLSRYDKYNGKVENINNDDIGTLYKAVLYATKKFMEQQHITKVVIGASGGIDSCLVAAIMSQIVDKKNLYLINMPSQYNSKTTIGIAEKLAKNIGCIYKSIPIEDSVDLTTNQIAQAFNFDKISEFNLQNVQARDRTSRILAAVASHIGGVYTCNGNKSELTVGYCTILGDLAGFLAPIADLWKTQVYAMSKYFNENIDNVIPEEAFTVMPSAELSESQNVDEGKGDPIIYKYHDKLFASWVERWDRATPEDILEWYMNGTIDKELGLESGEIYNIFMTKENFVVDLERWWNLYNVLSVVKRIYSPSIISVSRRSLGYDHRESVNTKPHYSSRYYKLKEEFLKEEKLKGEERCTTQP